jgi:ribonuclease VapC
VVAGTPGGAVLDASALLAMIHGEPGADMVRTSVSDSVVSSINWAETVQKISAEGLDPEETRNDLLDAGLRIASFDREDAETTAMLWPRARSVSLADRACLALARRLGLPVLTADGAWAALDLGIAIRLIR